MHICLLLAGLAALAASAPIDNPTPEMSIETGYGEYAYYGCYSAAAEAEAAKMNMGEAGYSPYTCYGAYSAAAEAEAAKMNVDTVKRRVMMGEAARVDGAAVMERKRMVMMDGEMREKRHMMMMSEEVMKDEMMKKKKRDMMRTEDMMESTDEAMMKADMKRDMYSEMEEMKKSKPKYPSYR
jgi:hypothetical protein